MCWLGRVCANGLEAVHLGLEAVHQWWGSSHTHTYIIGPHTPPELAWSAGFVSRIIGSVEPLVSCLRDRIRTYSVRIHSGALLERRYAYSLGYPRVLPM